MRLMFDAGHGGTKPGAICYNLKEKDITLLWATLLGWHFDSEMGEMHGYMQTREEDKTVSLDERVEDANSGWEPHAFISIHCNSNDGQPGKGFEIFHFPGSVQGKMLARAIYNKWPHPVKRGIKSANFKVLRETNMPAVLIELGFINHPVEHMLLQNLDFAMKGVVAIHDGIWDWSYENGTL